jgi:peptide/nickel transport system substrate-binding protein
VFARKTARQQPARPTWPATIGAGGRCACWFVVLTLFAFGTAAPARAQWIEQEDFVSPILDNEPFDLLYLNEIGEGAILKILPKKNPPPEPLPQSGVLVFEYADESGEVLQVPWSVIDSYKSFNDLLLDEANAWLQEEEYGKAFRSLLYIYDHGGKDKPALVAALRNCLFQDGKEKFQAGQFELALSIFEDIYRKDPSFNVPGIDSELIDIVLSCYDGMLRNQFENGDYVKVRKTLAAVEEEFQRDAAPLSEKWNRAFVAKSDELLENAKRFAADGQSKQAHLASRQAEQMSPGREVVKQLQTEILRQFRLIAVGVSQAGAGGDAKRIEHWGDRRVGRLTKRTIVELAGLTDEGGLYDFLNGELYRADESGIKYVLELKSEETDFATPPANAFQIASRLLAAANEESRVFDAGWAKVIDQISIEDGDKIVVTLRRSFVRPEALMDVTYFDPAEDDLAVQNGVYVATLVDGDFTTFEPNPSYTPSTARQQPVIIERLFGDASTAVDELVKGNIDVVDRIPVADLSRLKAEPEIIVRPYVLPTVHMLVPKIRGDLKEDMNFRSGLSHAINREMLVRDVFSGGQEIDGCEVISGPFPIGTAENDQIAYGYDLTVRPLSFNTKLSMVLIELALRPNKRRPEKLAAPVMVIAHSDSTSAREGAAAIARMWTDIGVPTSTRQLRPGVSVPLDEEWDFLYLEVTIEEPLADAARIIGPAGIAKDVSAPVEQTMRNLSYAESWRSACALLRRLHRQVAVDLSIIPLWQLREHYAYRNTVRGIGRDLIHLYQNVDRWQIDSYAAEEEE